MGICDRNYINNNYTNNIEFFNSIIWFFRFTKTFLLGIFTGLVFIFFTKGLPLQLLNIANMTDYTYIFINLCLLFIIVLILLFRYEAKTWRHLILEGIFQIFLVILMFVLFFFTPKTPIYLFGGYILINTQHLFELNMLAFDCYSQFVLTQIGLGNQVHTSFWGIEAMLMQDILNNAHLTIEELRQLTLHNISELVVVSPETDGPWYKNFANYLQKVGGSLSENDKKLNDIHNIFNIFKKK